MGKRDIENAQLGAKTLQDFFSQFGNDVYGQILLEELFRGLIENEIVFIFGEQEQKGDQADQHSPEQGNDDIQSDGSKAV